MLMSWNFSQCFYYRPPVLNIFQSNTPKFHCLQWINNTVLSLKYHAFFNQAPSLKQKLLERYFFMIRTITNLAAIIKGCSPSHACIYTVRVCVRDRERPLGWTPQLSCSCYLNYMSWLAHISHDWGRVKTEAKGCVNCEHKRTEPRVFVPCSQSARQVVE